MRKRLSIMMVCLSFLAVGGFGQSGTSSSRSGQQAKTEKTAQPKKKGKVAPVKCLKDENAVCTGKKSICTKCPRTTPKKKAEKK